MAVKITTQSTATHAAAPTGSAPAAGESTATAAENLDAALAAEFGDEGQPGDDAQAGEGDAAGDEAGASSTAGDGQENGEEGEEAGSGNDEDGEDDLPDEVDPEKPPKGMENLPKPVWKRIQKQHRQIKELKAELANASEVRIEPSAQSPLAHIQDTDALRLEIQTAKTVRQVLGKLGDADFTDNGKGQEIATVQHNGKQFVFTRDEVAAKLDYAERILDPDVLTERQAYLAERAQSQPREKAESILPGVLTPGKDAHKEYLALVQRIPELVTRLPNHEVIAALILRGQRQLTEEEGGKVKYVRMELDEAGKPKPPRVATKPAGAPAKAAPAGQRPPVSGSQVRKPSAADALAAKTGASQDERLDTALDAELGF